jgi:large subunit ribosomal protein L32
MAVPKYKTSKARKRTRSAANFKAHPSATTECPNCHEIRKQHTICENCGYYKGTHFVETKLDKKKAKPEAKA